MRALVTGATGTIGERLVRALGPDTIVLSRSPERAKKQLGVEARAWDGQATVDVDGIDAIFHLAGEPVAEGRWNTEKKRRIRDSRVLGTRALVQSIAAAKSKPAVLVSASAVGFYGDRGDEVLTEASAGGDGFLSEVCREWESEAMAAESHGARAAQVRVGIVLAREGGAFAKMLPLFRSGLAGRLGSGKQWMPWIHVDDIVALFLHAAHADVHGALNGVAPDIVTNADFTKALAKAVNRPAFFAAPKLLLSLALGETADVVVASQRAIPKKTLASGFIYREPKLEHALASLLEDSSNKSEKNEKSAQSGPGPRQTKR